MLAFKRCCFSPLTKPLTYQAVGISDNKTFVSFTVLWSGVYLTITELTPNKIVVYLTFMCYIITMSGTSLFTLNIYLLLPKRSTKLHDINMYWCKVILAQTYPHLSLVCEVQHVFQRLFTS